MSIVAIGFLLTTVLASPPARNAPSAPKSSDAPVAATPPAPAAKGDPAAPPSKDAFTYASPDRTLSLDAIELCGGREIPGSLDFLVNHDGISYLFSTEANRERFLKEPRAFEVVDGGACGRMGPLSGLGDARRHLVHEGRVYFFASEGCREAFRKDPTAFIERGDARPSGSAAAIKEGSRVMDLLEQWAGGAESWRRVNSIRLASARDRVSGKTTYSWTWETLVRFQDSVRVHEAWDASWFSTTRSPAGAAMASSRGVERIARSREQAFDRVIGRMPVMILRAWAAQRDRGAARASTSGDGITAIDAGVNTIDGTPVRLVDVWLLGATSRLAVDSGGKLLRQSFHGREGGSRVGEVARHFTAWTTVDGVTVPTAWRVTIDGKRFDDLAVSIDRVEVNPVLADDIFLVPSAVTASK